MGRSQDPTDLVKHVLTPWSATAWKEIEPMIGKAADAVGFLLEHGVNAAMNAFNPRR
ncbi:MAG: hypothetical protein WCK89_21740 [bacterium]